MRTEPSADPYVPGHGDLRYEVEEYDQVVWGIPFVRNGWPYEAFHDLDRRPGETLLLALSALPLGRDEGARVALLDARTLSSPMTIESWYFSVNHVGTRWRSMPSIEYTPTMAPTCCRPSNSGT